MSIEGIDEVTYGVEDMAAARNFWDDWGLHQIIDQADRLDYETLNGSTVRVRPLDALSGTGAIPRVVEHHFAQHDPDVAPGEGVVADAGHALRREALAADGQQPVAGLFRDP